LGGVYTKEETPQIYYEITKEEMEKRGWTRKETSN
jgi:hypothetical protein